MLTAQLQKSDVCQLADAGEEADRMRFPRRRYGHDTVLGEEAGGTATVSSTEPMKMRANRIAVETSCGICERGFDLAEEIYACPLCGGYHHVQCWDANLSCAAACTVGGGNSSGAVAERAATAAPPALAPDERRCPACSEVVKQKALKCHFCGAVFDSELAARITRAEMPSDLATEAEKRATESLTYALAGLIIFFLLLLAKEISEGYEALNIMALIILPPLLQVMAMCEAEKTLDILRDYPQHTISARGKAEAGFKIGMIFLTFLISWVLGFFGEIGP